MKSIVSKPIGGDGAMVTVALDDNQNLVLGVSYPLAKLVGPVDQAIDGLVAKVESALGNAGWAKAVLDPLDAAAKAELVSLLGQA